MKEEKKIIEAALFMSSRAMSLEEFRTLTGIGAIGYLKNAVAELMKEYDERGGSVEISEMDGKYLMRVRNEYLSRVRDFAQDTEISKGALRTLAYLSKHDGMLKSSLVKRIGTRAYGDVKELVENGFLKPKKSGRSAKLMLTEKFKIYFVQEKREEEPPAQTTL